MFKAAYPFASKFKYIAQTLAKVTDMIPFTVRPEGMEVKMLSPDKTTMIILRLPNLAFDSYECDSEKTFIVRADELTKIVRRGTRNDILEFLLDEERRRLVLVFRDKRTGVSRRFYLQLREGVVEKLGEPKIALPVKIRMLTEDFKNMLKDAKIVSDEIDMKAYSDRLEAIAEGHQKNYKNIMRIDKPLISYEASAEAAATYGLDLLEVSLKAMQACETVYIEFGENFPMKLTFDIPGGGVLIYWVAPRAKT